MKKTNIVGIIPIQNRMRHPMPSGDTDEKSRNTAKAKPQPIAQEVDL
jgi:hypothetical protein